MSTYAAILVLLELLFNPAIPLLGFYPKNPETSIRKNIITPLFIAALLTIAQIGKQPKGLSVDEFKADDIQQKTRLVNERQVKEPEPRWRRR